MEQYCRSRFFLTLSAFLVLSRRKVSALVACALAVAVLWGIAAEHAFEGTARSLLWVDGMAAALAAACALAASATWRGRAAAFALVVAVCVASLAIAFVAYNLFVPQPHG